LQTAKVELDVTLARGLNYYTGAIFEVQTKKVKMGSIGGGGRYDNLTGQFGMKNTSGIGISFGLDRIYLVLEELDLFAKAEIPKPKILFLNFGEEEMFYCLKAIKKIRATGINAEFYPEAVKLKKQMNYADKRKIPFVVLVGEQELNKGNYTLKNMNTGEQITCDLDQLIQLIKV
jgi:histidyl-tRNA synthetase